MRDWMTINDLSNYLQIPISRIRLLLKKNRIPYHKKLGSSRFFRTEINDWMMDTSDENDEDILWAPDFFYRGRPIKGFTLSASKILIGETAWDRLPDFIKGIVRLLKKSKREHLYRKEFDPLIGNFNDYLRLVCQLGFIEAKREGKLAHYSPTEYLQKVQEKDGLETIKETICESILNIVKKNQETIPQERHAILLLWHLLKIKEKGLEPEEAHFNRGGENNSYPMIRLNFATSLCTFLFSNDRSKEQDFLDAWEASIAKNSEPERSGSSLRVKRVRRTSDRYH